MDTKIRNEYFQQMTSIQAEATYALEQEEEYTFTGFSSSPDYARYLALLFHEEKGIIWIDSFGDKVHSLRIGPKSTEVIS